MAARPPTALYFTWVVALERDFAVIGGHLHTEEAEPTMTRPMVVNAGQWGHLPDVGDVVYGATRKPGPAPTSRPTLCMMGRMGLYREKVTGQNHVDGRIDIRGAGYLMDLRYIGRHLYSCGVQNQVHRQDGAVWSRADQGTFRTLAGQVDRSFESIDGFSEDDIYAVGKGGAVWHWNGKKWTPLESPTNYPLFIVLCSSAGDVYIGGSNGLIFKGDKDRGWTDLSDHGVTKAVYEDMTEFQGKIYVTATQTLVCTDGGRVQAVQVPVAGPKAYYAIDSVPGALWCVGDESVLHFDGTIWTRHVCPDNR